MNRTLIVTRAVVLVTLAACAPRADSRADTNTTGANSRNWAADSSAIVAAMESSRKGWNDADINAHYAPMADSVVMVFNAGPGEPPIRTLPNVREMADSMFKAKSLPAISEELLLIKPLGPDGALSVTRFTMKIASRPEPHRGLSTRVWNRTPAGWRMVADHTS